ncbi:MAG TPA: hypothetical protein VKO62_00535 [Solirubrobacterales bacterium]|nr:hypothetical protein [Solirubrobacterales bacterium]
MPGGAKAPVTLTKADWMAFAWIDWRILYDGRETFEGKTVKPAFTTPVPKWARQLADRLHQEFHRIPDVAITCSFLAPVKLSDYPVEKLRHHAEQLECRTLLVLLANDGEHAETNCRLLAERMGAIRQVVDYVGGWMPWQGPLLSDPARFADQAKDLAKRFGLDIISPNPEFCIEGPDGDKVSAPFVARWKALGSGPLLWQVMSDYGWTRPCNYQTLLSVPGSALAPEVYPNDDGGLTIENMDEGFAAIPRNQVVPMFGAYPKAGVDFGAAIAEYRRLPISRPRGFWQPENLPDSAVPQLAR